MLKKQWANEMAFLSSLNKIWAIVKPDIVRIISYIKSNDVAKLIIFAAFIGKCQSQKIISTYIGYDISIIDIFEHLFFFTLNVFFIFYLLSFLYYCSFNIKKTIYTLPKIFYILSINLFVLKIYIETNMSLFSHPFAIFIYKFLYSFVFLFLLFNLRKILIQQYNNVQNSIFKKVQNYTGLVIIASTPHHFYSRKRLSLNHYMLGFNTNIKTWFTLGVFIIMEKDGLYFKKTFINYNEIVLFNQSFNKKFTSYSKNELETTLMYTI